MATDTDTVFLWGSLIPSEGQSRRSPHWESFSAGALQGPILDPQG